MKYVKDKEIITPKYIAMLHDEILGHQQDIFDPKNEAHSWDDFCRWPDILTDRNHLIMPGEVFLCDRSIPTRVGGEHWYCIISINEKGKVKMEEPVIKVSELYKGWRNGYFLLPEIPYSRK